VSTLRPICVPCRLEMRCVKNNRVVADPAAASGPSTYWLGDEYECPECRSRVVVGFGEAMATEPSPLLGDVLHFEYERPEGGAA